MRGLKIYTPFQTFLKVCRSTWSIFKEIQIQIRLWTKYQFWSRIAGKIAHRLLVPINKINAMDSFFKNLLKMGKRRQYPNKNDGRIMRRRIRVFTIAIAIFSFLVFFRILSPRPSSVQKYDTNNNHYHHLHNIDSSLTGTSDTQEWVYMNPISRLYPLSSMWCGGVNQSNLQVMGCSEKRYNNTHSDLILSSFKIEKSHLLL